MSDTATPLVEAASFMDVISLLLACPGEHAQDSARVAWLVLMADALTRAGFDADASQTRERALRIVRCAVDDTAGTPR